MVSKCVVAAIVVSQMIAGVAFAQSAVPAASDEFGRVSAGEIELLGKHSSRLSGSFGISASRSQLPFATGTAKGYGATFGGTIVQDRLWFFASAEQSSPIFPQSQVVEPTALRRIDTNFSAQLGDRQDLAASFAVSRPNPASFLSLHYTGIVSSNMFFTAKVSRDAMTQRNLPFVSVVQPR